MILVVEVIAVLFIENTAKGLEYPLDNRGLSWDLETLQKRTQNSHVGVVLFAVIVDICVKNKGIEVPFLAEELPY